MRGTKLRKIAQCAPWAQGLRGRVAAGAAWLLLLCLALASLLGARLAQAQQGALTTVMIDPGHGGKDPGTRGAQHREKDVVLSVATKLGEYIKREFPAVQVRYTRHQDTFIALKDRSEMAIAERADLFISIHCNWAPNPGVVGAESYVMGLHRSKSNLEVAQRENAVIAYEEDYSTKYEGYDPKSPESFMIFSLIQNVFLDQSLEFASLVQQEFTQRAKRADRGVRQAGFLVLYKSTMPAILIELGFLSNPKEEAFLASEQGQEYMASAIFRAFRSYKHLRDANSVPYLARGQGARGDTAGPPPSPAPRLRIVYRVQVATLTKPLAANHPLRREFPNLIQVKDGRYYRYYMGETASYEEASGWLKAVGKRYKDSFIVALREGQRISIEQARSAL